MVRLFPAGTNERMLRRAVQRLRNFGYLTFGRRYMRNRMPYVGVIPLNLTEMGHTELARYIDEMFEGDLKR